MLEKLYKDWLHVNRLFLAVLFQPRMLEKLYKDWLHVNRLF